MSLRGACPGSSRRRRSTARRRSSSTRRGSSRPARTSATSAGFNFLSDITAADYLGWGEQGRRRLHRHRRAAATSTRPASQGLAAPARAEAEALLRQLPPARARATERRARARAGLARRRRAGAERRRGLADRRLARARGLGHDGHPRSRATRTSSRILMEDDWEGHPLRKDYPIGGEPVRFSERGVDGDRARADARGDLRGHADPAPDPDRARRSRRSSRDSDDVLTVNFGPNHPSTHGVLRLVVDLDGEDVVGLERRDRLPPHRLREEHGAEDVVEGDHVPASGSTTSPSRTTSSSSCSRSRSCSSSRSRRRRPGCGRCSAS